MHPCRAALLALLLLPAAACNRTSSAAKASAGAPADSTAAALQKRDTLPTGVTVDTQKVDAASSRETPQQDEEPAQ